MGYKVVYAGDTAGTGRSHALWGDCPWLEALEDNNIGYGKHDDFVDYDTTATTVKNASGTPVFEGDCTVLGTAAKHGEIALFGTSDNEEAALQQGGVNSAPYIISDTTADARKLWFEARVKKSLITDALGAFFVGLAGENSGVADFMADAGTDFADVDLIGFWNDPTEDSVSSHVDFVFQITGTGFVTVISTVATLVANTYVNLGFKYDPDADITKRIKIYVDGVEQSTYVTGTATSPGIAHASFPDGEEMSPLIAIKQQSNNDMTVTMDWWRAFQRR